MHRDGLPKGRRPVGVCRLGGRNKGLSLNADDGTFSVLGDRDYAKDKDRVFYQNRTIDGADPSTFEVINKDNFSKDGTHVYFREHEIIGADPASFRVLQLPYSRDAKRVYCGTVPMEADVDAFEPVEWYGLWVTEYDKHNSLFEHGESFDKLDISRERPAVTGWGGGRDGKYYYCGPGRVDGADYASFKMVSQSEASDQDRRYVNVFPAEQLPERRKRFWGPGISGAP